MIKQHFHGGVQNLKDKIFALDFLLNFFCFITRDN